MISFSPAYVGDDDNMQVRIIAGATVAVVVLLVIIIIMTVLFLRRFVSFPQCGLFAFNFEFSAVTYICFSCSRGSDECNKKQPSDCDTLEYRNGEGWYFCLCFLQLLH